MAKVVKFFIAVMEVRCCLQSTWVYQTSQPLLKIRSVSVVLTGHFECASIATNHIYFWQSQYVSFLKDVEEIPMGVMELLKGCFCAGHTLCSSLPYLECHCQSPATIHIFRLTSSFHLSPHEHGVASEEGFCE